MRTFTCPAKYRAVIEGAIAMALASVARDAKHRDDEDERVRRYRLDDTLVDERETGTLLITVAIPNAGAATLTLLGDDLRTLSLTASR
jgi:hypothetical protein